MLIGGFAAAFAFGISSISMILIIVSVSGSDATTNDIGDIFVKANAVAEYADERLAAATNGVELPEPPVILADGTALKIALAGTLAFNAALFLIAGIGSGLSFTDLTRTLGLRRFYAGGAWRPVVACFLCYLGVGAYTLLMRELEIGFLVPNSTVPGGVLRDPQAIALTAGLAVISAPFVEELFFRGFMFGGLARWGFWPAALISSTVFTLVHFDPGSIIPFFVIGMVMAYLFKSKGSLWDSILFHMLFNGTSFLLLVTR